MTMLMMTLCLSLGERVRSERRRASLPPIIHPRCIILHWRWQIDPIAFHIYINNTYLPIRIITSPKLLLPNPSSMHFHCSRTISLATRKSSQ